MTANRRAAGKPWTDAAREMVEALAPLDARVAAAMASVPRHRFVPPELADEAYDDTPLPLGVGDATISAPHMVALQLEWAELAAGQRVLEVGAGSGYLAVLAATLVRPGGRVLGLEVERRLAERAGAVVRELGFADRVEVRCADGRAGAPDRAPFDRILVSCATPEIFPAWRRELAPDGVLVAPVGNRWGQVLRRLRRSPAGDRVEDGPPCLFVSIVAPAGPYK